MTAHYLLVGADPKKAGDMHPGGVLTLSIGLLDYAERHGHTVTIIDTLRSGFVREPLRNTLAMGLARLGRLWSLLWQGNVAGCFIFSGAGVGFFERVIMSLLCRLFSVKDVLVIVDGGFFAIQHAPRWRKQLTRLLLKIPHRVAATGQKWHALFVDLGIPDPRIVDIQYWLGKGLPLADKPKMAGKRSELHFLFVGWMTEGKGVRELMAAIAELRARHRFQVSFVGGGTLLEEVRFVIRERGWEESVRALGWASDAHLHELRTNADVFVLPSHAEGFPMSLIEAFSAGMPAIVTDVGGVADSLSDGKNGFLIVPKSVPSLVAAMEQYLGCPELVALHSPLALQAAIGNHDSDRNCDALFAAVGN